MNFKVAVANIFKNEQFMEDATSELFMKRIKAVKTREDDYIWTIPPTKKSTIRENVFSKTQARLDNCIWPVPTDRMACEREIPLKKIEETNKINAPKKFDIKEESKKETVCNDVILQEEIFNSSFIRNIRKSEKESSKNYPIGTEGSQSDKFPVHHRPVINKSERKLDGRGQSTPNLHHVCRSEKKESTTKNSFQHWCTQRQLNFQHSVKQPENDTFVEVAQHHHDTITKKRIRHDSGTSIQSKTLKQNAQIIHKKYPVKQHDANRLTNSVNSMVSIKIMSIGDEKSCYDHTVNMKDLVRVKKTFRKMDEILPNVGQPKREINYCAVVVKSILGWLFNPCYILDGKLDGKMALELLSATQSWEINRLYSIYEKKFLEKMLKEKNAKELYAIAYSFQLDKLSKACLQACNAKELPDIREIRYKLQKCFVSVSIYQESLNFCISLQETKPTLQDNCERDIKNEIVFEALSGCYVITGIQIYLDCEANGDVNQRMLNLYYTVENLSENTSADEDESRKPVRKGIVIYFNNNLVLKPGQKGKITLQTEIEPCLCFVSEDETVISPKNEFRLSLRSNFKVNKSDKKRFLIQKIFYLANADTSAM